MKTILRYTFIALAACSMGGCIPFFAWYYGSPIATPDNTKNWDAPKSMPGGKP